MCRIFVLFFVLFSFLGSQTYAKVLTDKIIHEAKDNKKSSKEKKQKKKKRIKIVGVIGDRLPNENNQHDYTHWPIYAMRYQYIDNFAKVCKDNNIAFVILPDDLSQTEKFANAIDALVLTGGGDDPTGIRDKFERDMLLLSIINRKQVFGICRGMQMINHIFGGEIVELKDVIKTNETHKQAPYCLTCEQTVHSVNLEPNSRIGKILNEKTIDVNSNHNFIVGKLAEHVIITGRSPDGIPEVLEMPEYSKYLLAVQWHPEFLATKHDEKLIKSFCNAVEHDE